MSSVRTSRHVIGGWVLVAALGAAPARGDPTLPPPGDFTAILQPANQVQLKWSNLIYYDTILVSRAGEPRAALPGDATSYVDDISTFTGPDLRYELVGTSGAMNSEMIVAHVRSIPPECLEHAALGATQRDGDYWLPFLSNEEEFQVPFSLVGDVDAIMFRIAALRGRPEGDLWARIRESTSPYNILVDDIPVASIAPTARPTWTLAIHPAPVPAGTYILGIYVKDAIFALTHALEADAAVEAADRTLPLPPYPLVSIVPLCDNIPPVITNIETRDIEPLFGDLLREEPLLEFGYLPEKTAMLACDAFDPDGAVTHYRWDFGDGAPAESGGDVVAHMYPDYGTYTVNVTVTDDRGAVNSFSRGITVEPTYAPVPAGNPPGVYDLTPDPRNALHYIPNLASPDVNDTFQVWIQPAVDAGEALTVVLELIDPGSGGVLDSQAATKVSPTDHDRPFQYEATFNMSALPELGDVRVRARATDDHGRQGSNEWTFDLCPLPGLFTDLPGLVSTRVDYHADADEYDLTAMVPTGPIYESQFDVPFLGTLNNLIDAHLTFHEYLRMGDWHPQSLQGHMQATLLDYDLFEHDWEMSLPEGADLSYRCDAFEIQYATYGQSLFSDEWAWEVFDTTLWQGFVGPVPVRVVGSLDVGLGVDVNADVVIVVRDTEPVVTLDVWINPAITGWAAGEIRVEILFGLASASVRLRPSITIELPIHGYLDDTLNLQVSVDDCYRLRLDVRVRACAIFCYTSPWIEIFNCNFSCPGEEDGCALGLNSRAGQPPPDDELPSDLKYPSIAIAPDGSKTMVVYIKDSDVDPGVYRPDPHFALDTGTGYSAPASIQPADQYSQRDTSVVFLSNASALAVWTQGRLTHAEEEALPLTPEGANTGFKNSDIFYSQWSTVAGWAAPQALLEDTTPNPLIPDGRPAVAAGPGANSAWVAWVRSDNEDMLVTTGPQAGEVILSGMSIYARRIVDGLPSGPAIKLSNDDVVPNQYADIQPTVAVSPAGNTVLVVWVRDLDSDFNTSTDRLLMYAVWFAGMWYAPAPVTDPAELPGVLMPSIALSSDFDGMLTFTVRETNPAGTPAGEGNKDIVYAMQIIGASFQPAVPLTHGPTATQRPVYGRDPVARYLDSAHAAIVFRSFDGFGRDGGDGELAVASIDLSQPTPVWAFARDLTNDNYRDWDIAAAVDPAGQIRTIRDSAGGDPAFDSLLAQDIPTGPDVDIQSLEFDSPHIPAGSLVSLTVRVANAGLRTAGPTPPPNTILRVGRLVGDVFQEIAATPFTFDAAPGTALAFRYEDLDYASSEPQTWRAIVEPISGEYDTTNNVADVVLGVLPPVNMACVPVFDGGPSKVGLTWANAESYQEILIDRNGRLIARLAGDAESYVDNRVAPGTHEWSVRGRIASGVSAAAAATCTSEVPRRGDLNCSGEVGFGDINPFVLILSNPAAWQAAYPGCPLLNGDINGDGSVNFADINPFVALLSGG